MASDGGFRDNPEKNRFELEQDGRVAILAYERRPDALVLIHTEVPPELRGHHVGEAIVRGAIAAARSEGRTIVPLCPFVRAYMERHPQ